MQIKKKRKKTGKCSLEKYWKIYIYMRLVNVDDLWMQKACHAFLLAFSIFGSFFLSGRREFLDEGGERSFC